MFSTCDALVMNKYDMLPYFEFDDKRVEKDAMGVNPQASVFRVSTRTGSGLDDFITWLTGKIENTLN